MLVAMVIIMRKKRIKRKRNTFGNIKYRNEGK